MDSMEENLGSILGDPQLMQTIMKMAQRLGQPAPAPEQPAPPPPSRQPELGGMEAEMIRQIIDFTRQTGLDSNQQRLLQALGPYLSQDRVGRLEKAMHAAKLAQFAAAAMGQNDSGR